MLSKSAYRVTIDADAESGQDFEAVLDAAGFIFAKVPSSDIPIVQELEAFGFRLVDVGLQLEASKVSISRTARGEVRTAVPGDEEEVKRLAGTSFVWSRFHSDPLIPNETANEIKSAWAGNFFRGERGDTMVVAEAGGEVAGFLLLLWDSEKKLVIDLIAVAADARGRGLGLGMIGFAAQHLNPSHGWRVGTQLANRASLQLYEQAGFRMVSSEIILHRHGSGEPS